MNLNNQISRLNGTLEDINNRRDKMKAEEEETQSRQLNKISQLSKILMAINCLEKICIYRGKSKD